MVYYSDRLLELWREMLEKAQEIERELEKAIEEEAARDEDCKILQTAPRVGPFTALLVRAEVGDIRRFKKWESLVSYISLAPRLFQSGERCYYGSLGKWGNRWLRYGLGLLAQPIAQSKEDSSLRRDYWRVCLRRDKNSAKIAVARKAVKIFHHMLTEHEAWNDCVEVKSAKMTA